MKCSHLCLTTPEGASCACPEGTSFIPDTGNTICDAGILVFKSFATWCYQFDKHWDKLDFFFKLLKWLYLDVWIFKEGKSEAKCDRDWGGQWF